MDVLLILDCEFLTHISIAFQVIVEPVLRGHPRGMAK